MKNSSININKNKVNLTTYAISDYHHYRCEFESRSCEVYSLQHYVIKFVKDLRQVGGFLRVLRFPTPIKVTTVLFVFGGIVYHHGLNKLPFHYKIFKRMYL